MKIFVSVFKVHLTFVPLRPINNELALVQIMAWHRTGDKSWVKIQYSINSEYVIMRLKNIKQRIILVYMMKVIMILHFSGLVQDCSNSSANTLELLQPCTKPLIWCYMLHTVLSHYNPALYNWVIHISITVSEVEHWAGLNSQKYIL